MKTIDLTVGRFLFPVIHVETLEQTERNIKVAEDSGVDGVFLINHHGSGKELLEIALKVVTKYPETWFGINCLDMTFDEVLDSNFIGNIWTDNALDEDSCLNGKHLCSGLYFGGIDFKYQPPVKDMKLACELVIKATDVATTSGCKTGKPPTLDKIKQMKEYLGDHPLAIASGITLENVGQFLPYVTCFLVSTGISSDFSNLNPDKVKALSEKIHSYDRSSAHN